jgi:hypothetical protein
MGIKFMVVAQKAIDAFLQNRSCQRQTTTTPTPNPSAGKPTPTKSSQPQAEGTRRWIQSTRLSPK